MLSKESPLRKVLLTSRKPCSKFASHFYKKRINTSDKSSLVFKKGNFLNIPEYYVIIILHISIKFIKFLSQDSYLSSQFDPALNNTRPDNQVCDIVTVSLLCQR